MEEEERFGGKYSEQQAREGGSERAKEAARLTDLQYLLTLVVETQRPVRLPARGSLAKPGLNYLFCQQSGGHGG